MGFLDKLLKNRASRRDDLPRENEEAVLIQLRGDGLPQSTYDQYDVSGLEEELATALDGSAIGELDGHEFGPEGATLYLYGSDAEVLFKTIEPVLRSYPLCEKSFVTIRQGKPGAPQRVVLL